MGVVKVEGLKDSAGEGFPTVPAGRYLCRITEIKDKQLGESSKYPGNPSIMLVAKVQQGEDNEGHTFVWNQTIPTSQIDDEEYRSREVNKLKRLAIAAGLDVEEDEFDTSNLNGCDLIIIAGVEEKQGQPKRNVVKDVLPVE